jgi:hypothetical protein
MKKARSFLTRTGLVEALVWTVALIYLAIAIPTHEAHFTACPLSAAGFSFCPGCGLGRSITFLFHGQLYNSFNMHWLGIPATAFIAWRIFYLFRRIINHYQTTS